MSRMQLIRDARNGQCVEGCNRHWLECAQEVLKNNNIHPVVFSSALKELLTKGRGKFRNLLLVGCTCSGKTFLLDPLCALFKTFVNPAVDKYAWVGAEGCVKSSTSTIFDGAPPLFLGRIFFCFSRATSFTCRLPRINTQTMYVLIPTSQFLQHLRSQLFITAGTVHLTRNRDDGSEMEGV